MTDTKKACNNFRPMQEPATDTTVCETCGLMKSDHKTPRETVHLVCVGKGLSAGKPKKKVFLFHFYNPDTHELDKEERIWDAKAVGKGVLVGATYKTERDVGESSKIYVPLKYVGTWPNKEDRFKWDTAARAEETAQELSKDFEKESKRNFLKEHLEPIRKVYQKQMPARQAAMLAQIIYYVEHGTFKVYDDML